VWHTNDIKFLLSQTSIIGSKLPTIDRINNFFKFSHWLPMQEIKMHAKSSDNHGHKDGCQRNQK
jgi:hypothetical protein